MIIGLCAITAKGTDQESSSDERSSVYYGYSYTPPTCLVLTYTNGWSSSSYRRCDDASITNGFPYGTWADYTSPMRGLWGISHRLILNTNGTLRYEAEFKQEGTDIVKRTTGFFSLISTSQVLLTIRGDFAHGPGDFGQPFLFRERDRIINGVKVPGGVYSLQASEKPRSWEYKVDHCIHAAMTLQARGVEKACDTLLALSKPGHYDSDQNQLIFVLCRMLFVAKPGGEFRRPATGQAAYLGGTGCADWPLEPIECIDGVPFLIATGAASVGVAETRESYVQYCMSNCVWSSRHWRLPSSEEKRAALASLLSSKAWKRPLDERENKYLAAQIEDVK